jgi:amino-acid N-acetyltransferase
LALVQTDAISIRPALHVVRQLLGSQGLPSEDLSESHLEHFLFAGSDCDPTALVGVELYGENALLRSLAVRPADRKRGLGSRLVAGIEEYSRTRGVEKMFLLTTTAQHFFATLGYQLVERQSAPASIRSTREFSDLCPASSVFMMKALSLR